jgi:hypothetical protein
MTIDTEGMLETTGKHAQGNGSGTLDYLTVSGNKITLQGAPIVLKGQPDDENHMLGH